MILFLNALREGISFIVAPSLTGFAATRSFWPAHHDWSTNSGRAKGDLQLVLEQAKITTSSRLLLWQAGTDDTRHEWCVIFVDEYLWTVLGSNVMSLEPNRDQASEIISFYFHATFFCCDYMRLYKTCLHAVMALHFLMFIILSCSLWPFLFSALASKWFWPGGNDCVLFCLLISCVFTLYFLLCRCWYI